LSGLPDQLPIILAIFFIAGTVKGVMGFGLPIITMSALPFLIPVEQAIVLSAIVQPFTNIMQLLTSGGIKRAISLSWPVIIALLPGSLIGAWYLASLDSNTLLIFVGVTIFAFSALNLIGYQVTIPKSKSIVFGAGFGFIAGIFGVLTSLNGWAFIMYLVGLGATRQEFRSALAFLFLVSGFLISSSYWTLGLLSLQHVLIGGLALVAAFPGMWVGDRLGKRLPAEAFRKILLLALIFIGLLMIWRAFG